MIFLVVVSICGWFYVRNYQLYHQPIIINLDLPQFKMTGAIPRNILFFIDLSGFLKADLFNAHHYSFLAGTFYSFFYDGQNTIIPVQQFSKAGLVLVFFSLPLVIFFLIGIFNELKSKNKNILFLIYPLLLFISYIYLNIKYPIYGSVNARYITSIIIPFTYFVVQSIKLLNKKYYPYISLYLLIYVFLIIKNFWILNSWYKY
jgi:hypothetical protein